MPSYTFVHPRSGYPWSGKPWSGKPFGLASACNLNILLYVRVRGELLSHTLYAVYIRLWLIPDPRYLDPLVGLCIDGQIGDLYSSIQLRPTGRGKFRGGFASTFLSDYNRM
jgi:hypothetical protein